ncbi:DNA repair protein RadA [Anaerobiospirillum thomasii]|uniref:DNA repair protein RadA n=1 Tax=Anaerobiospirillum thomasii TaxID=179995 RepID=A0A2X0WS02_9GAMM|nr:DNA repair protein RadA [Anaerobiospirillum thomasii]SPT68211.1 DNA repair protein RadA [Anaerobiospirillum thomasii]SPT70689.1 DNA repair protein RadA [Anaerobiospirillum thomasii]
MAKVKTVYICAQCGARYTRWQGQCKECGQWNTISESVVERESSASAGRAAAQRAMSGFAGASGSGISSLDNVQIHKTQRLSTGYSEFDRALGGGIVPGSVVLIGGNPGAGKSTLLLQMICRLSLSQRVLYVTGEESLEQVAIRAKRLNLETHNVRIAAETSIDTICQFAATEKPAVLIVDSIQVMHVQGVESAPGSVSQVREGAAALTQFAKRTGIAVFMIGHVTKDGTIAGPKILEHCVDCSVILESGSDPRFRTLRCHKNRFGAINEIGVFAMTDTGLKEVKNPSAIFLNRQDEVAAGSLAMVVWEGTRPLLVELQALVDNSYGNPRRLSIGTDSNRLSMLLSVLHRHAGVSFNDQDVFINVVGGVKVEETASDVPLVLALLSSFNNKALDRSTIAFGEIGLTGEIRPVPSGQERIAEAFKQGFTTAIVPYDNMPRKAIEGMDVIPIRRVVDLINLV